MDHPPSDNKLASGKSMDQSEYVEFKKQAAEGLQSSATQFDKAILTLAAGALALSLTFVKELVPSPDGTTIFLLACSWGAFIGSIVLTLSSFQLSMFAYMRHDKIIDTIYAAPDIDRSIFKNRWNRITIALNICSLVVFIVGTVFLTYAVYDNLKTRGDKMPYGEPARVEGGAITPGIPVASQRGAPTPAPAVAPPRPGTGHIPGNPPVAPPRPVAPPPQKK
jgi:hypothetical protein